MSTTPKPIGQKALAAVALMVVIAIAFAPKASDADSTGRRVDSSRSLAAR